MSGTVEGGHKARDTNFRLYGKTFYGVIGHKGGKLSKGGGFAANPELAREAGRKGGSTPRKSYTRKKDTECGRGHEFTFENTGISLSSGRYCKKCASIRSLEYYHRQKALDVLRTQE